MFSKLKLDGFLEPVFESSASQSPVSNPLCHEPIAWLRLPDSPSVAQSLTGRRTYLTATSSQNLDLCPVGINQVEKRAVLEAALKAKASPVYLVGEAMAAAIRAALPITEPVAT
jgi:hypothetical protein